MTTKILPNCFATFIPAQSNRSNSSLGALTFGVFRLPTDPLFYATLTLQNVVASSRYRVVRNDTGAELSTGVGGGSDIVLTNLPAYANPMLCKITVRNASGATKYKPNESFANLAKAGGSAYIVQVVD